LPGCLKLIQTQAWSKVLSSKNESLILDTGSNLWQRKSPNLP
jgi:hypothetical protein